MQNNDERRAWTNTPLRDTGWHQEGTSIGFGSLSSGPCCSVGGFNIPKTFSPSVFVNNSEKKQLKCQ